jgi:membrane-associated protease RseP (regulator of RpoE activity)
MLNEPASSSDNRPLLDPTVAAPTPPNKRYDEARDMVGNVLRIDHETFYDENTPPDFNVTVISPESRPMASFSGQLLLESEAAYEKLDALCAPLDLLPAFREGTAESPHIVHLLRGRPNPSPRGWVLNLILFVLTFATVLMAGALIGIAESDAVSAQVEQCLDAGGDFACIIPHIWRGFPYAISLLLILGAHEFGHYFLARRHKLAVTLPYFIPFPSSFGTMGAFIQLRQPMRNRKMLMDVGAAGPLIGLLFAIPIVAVGIATSPINVITPNGSTEGNSFLYALLKTIIFGRFYPSGGEDMYMNQLAQAGWTGLFVTALNLIPVGQLDGGHTLYALIGRRARYLYYPLLAVVIGLSLIPNNEVWLLWVILLFLFGRIHAVPLDDLTPLDPLRKRVALLALFVFIIIFVPVPFTPSEMYMTNVTLPTFMATLWLNRRR